MSSKILSALFIVLFVCFQAGAILIDKITAVVNDEIITLTDINKAVQFFPYVRAKNEKEEAFNIRVLEDLIDWKAVYLEYKESFKLSEEDYEEVEAQVIKKLGSLDRLMSQLAKYDMEWADFEIFIQEKVAYDKVLKEEFMDEIKVDFKEIEIFYNTDYVPRQEKLNLKPRTLIEMTPLIEKQLKKSRSKEKAAAWLKELKSSYKIENKLLEESK